jgi:hypothetical protein
MSECQVNVKPSVSDLRISPNGALTRLTSDLGTGNAVKYLVSATC